MKDKVKILFSIVITLMIVGIISFSYALFTIKIEKKGALNIAVGNVSCPIESKDLTNNQITLKADAEREIEITLTNQSLTNIHSTITYSGNNVEVSAASSNESAIEVESLAIGNTKTYILRLKNNGTSDETITFYGRCGLSNKTLVVAENESKITETYERIEPNTPKLVEGLIPVVYDESQKSWVKANTTKQWYNYYNQEWANAVTVKLDDDGVSTKKRESYQTAEAGTPILMDDINTMWVWIPRYEYNYVSIKNAGGYKSNCTSSIVSGNYECYLNPGEIKVNFINGTSNTVSTDDYIVHPAFTFGSDELTGFWYGKFETSSKEECTAINFSVDTECDIETYTPEIRPSVTSWRGIRVSTAFEVSRRMQTTNNNVYGFSNSQTSYDTHMSKNSEWGAVVYLSQSKYGKYGKDQTEVLINSCSQFRTGAARCSEDYTSTNGLKTSTTGNITGVYDMSGGTIEYVMGALDDGTGKPRSGGTTQYNSGFNGVLNSGSVENGRAFPDEKYYDLYSGDAAATACDKGVCYGHALSETPGWYGDEQGFVISSTPWLQRGGNCTYSSTAGVFWFYGTHGNANVDRSFRLVLAPIGA